MAYRHLTYNATRRAHMLDERVVEASDWIVLPAGATAMQVAVTPDASSMMRVDASLRDPDVLDEASNPLAWVHGDSAIAQGATFAAAPVAVRAVGTGRWQIYIPSEA